MVLTQQFQIHSGFSIKAVRKSAGNQVAQIFISRPVFAQQDQMVRVIVNAENPI